ncbi:GNAT family N-acetyltransferase [Salibacterium halotolerans]|uniref:Predicted N-acetyltransferase YhbS n=1 Tax=Salibacterium halotolerans TaxID=1884432 RepID=A0A1I5PQL8_9BACI|nr:N-acetyltransferase [Salibacterium halotolerans]SFP36120.1 Predicted N-acetyltransferase YhbS [Salibacterium halotolerans]
MNITIRQETPADYRATETLVNRTFGDAVYSDPTEHVLVENLRESEAFIPELSLVALDSGWHIVGHILLSRITIENNGSAVNSLALAPVSVAPERQNQGIGTQLMRDALKRAGELGFSSVVVLGHPEYYAKFGFERADHWNIQAPFKVPPEAFMVLELTAHTLDKVQGGIVQYSWPFMEE